ncbi:DUF2240 family protein [Halopenitus sp. POP-27]|uniref:DUF2240 family protein n=1 Tax=Halopenitus sp. POP-27 TaxID=2994425 RepID=UPI00246890C3|nr:DUF2240 family protein [Halopenitus sp. POP-27]
MSLRTAVAAPFRQQGRDRLGEGEFVVALSLDRDWFSPDQAKRLVDVATGRGLLDREDDDLVPAFDPDAVNVPEGFTPDESILREQSTFERALEAVVDAGVDKRTAVAAINERQRGLEITIEAAAVLYANEQGVDVGPLAGAVREDLLAGEGVDADADVSEADDADATEADGADANDEEADESPHDEDTTAEEVA